ncbi:MAG: 4Fe-4S ferredoxin [Eggerthella lenta]
MSSIVRAVYFSPTRTTKTIVQEVAGALAAPLDASVEAECLTLPAQRPADVSCAADDVLVFGFPVYAGRVPVLLRDEFAHLEGRGTPAVVVGLYGNRAFDDALLEAADLLEERGFNVTAAGAFIGEHSLTARVGTGRPDDADIAVAQRFGADLGERLARSRDLPAPAIKGSRPNKALKPGADVRPLTSDACTSCGICVARCPLGHRRGRPASWEPDASTLRVRQGCPEDASTSSSRPTR